MTLFVLDFDNAEGDARVDWLSGALKDMILLRMEGEPGLVMRDAEEIEPYLVSREPIAGAETIRPPGSSLVLMGAFQRDEARLLVDFQLLDMADWSRLGRAKVVGLYSDIPQLHELLITAVRAKVDSLAAVRSAWLETIVVEPPPKPEKRERVYTPPPGYGEQLPGVQDDLLRAIEGLEEAMDTYSGYRQGPPATRQEGEVYYRDFTLEGLGLAPEEKARNTELFEEVLRQVAQNPYSAEIGDLELEVDPYNNHRVYISIPVAYRVKQALLQDMLQSLPYVATREEGGLRTIRYDRSKFDFSSGLIDQIARGDFRVVPVVQLMDPQGRPQAVIIDSPDLSWERYASRSTIKVVRQKRFVPLLAITTSGFNVDVRLETVDADVVYELDIEAGNLTKYARVAVRFMKEDDLLLFLRRL